MEHSNIFEQIRKERYDFLNNEVTIVSNYTFSQYNTIKKNHLYYTSHFENGDYEVINGVKRKKTFHNINSWRCDVATKMLDVDTKDFLLIPNSPEQDINVMMLEKELKHWMKREKFGKILNQVVNDLPIQGTVVLRKYGNNDAKIVDLRYLYNDQSAESLRDAEYIIIRNLMSYTELVKMKSKWDNVENVIDNFHRYASVVGYDNLAQFGGTNVAITQDDTRNMVEVWERFGEFPKSWITKNNKDDDTYVWGKFVCAGIDAVQQNEEGKIIGEDGTILWAEELDKDKEFPFREVHYRKIVGRWLGQGIVEMTWEPQRRINEIKNQEAKALELASVQLFQTRSTNALSNILTDADTGDLITTNSEITPIATESRNLAGFQQAFTTEDQHADRLTFSYDAVRGEQAPASATLGSVQIQEQQATSAFDYKRENVALFLQEFITDIVLPALEPELNKEHVFRLTGSMEELQKLRMNVAQNYAHQKAVDLMLEGELVTQEMYDMLVDEELTSLAKDGDAMWVSVRKNFFKNLDYYVDLVVSGENRNIFAQVGNAQAILQALQDPTILQDAGKKAVFFKALSGLGMHISELQDLESKVQEQQAAMQQQPMQPAPQMQQPVMA